MGEIELLAAMLAEAQRKALLWCNEDGSPRVHRTGDPREVSFFALSKVIKGDPFSEAAQIYSLVRSAISETEKRGLWPATTWRLTPLGQKVHSALRARASITRTTGDGDG